MVQSAVSLDCKNQLDLFSRFETAYNASQRHDTKQK